MKKVIVILAALSVCLSAWAGGWKKVEASDLTLLGKGMETANPYHRVDTVKYKGFTVKENRMCRESAGLAVVFKTNASDIRVCAQINPENTTYEDYRSYRGFDLYIMKDGRWTWAGATSFKRNDKDDTIHSLVNNMDDSVKECILYLPIYSELNGCQVCVPDTAWIEPMESPFRHNIVFHGSSFTHGVSCTRAGMSYPMQFMRRTGMQVIPLGFSGRCRMQPYFATVIEDVEADAYVFDPFSNLPASEINKVFMPFFERVVAAHPDKPIIIQRTIYWERSNFNREALKVNMDRWAASDSLCNILCKKYPNVYYIKPDAALHNGESSSADGVHPNDNGYSLWEASIEKPILKILKKYGIR